MSITTSPIAAKKIIVVINIYCTRTQGFSIFPPSLRGVATISTQSRILMELGLGVQGKSDICSKKGSKTFTQKIKLTSQ